MLYLNYKLFQFKFSTTSLSFHCNINDETVKHLFSKCNEVISLWAEIKLCFVNDIKIIALCPQIAILGYAETNARCFITQKLILLVFKLYVYKSRGSGNLSFSAFFHKIVKIKNLRKRYSLKKSKKTVIYKNKCSFPENAFHSE